MRAMFLGHSLVARRQWMFALEMKKYFDQILILPPDQWGSRKYSGLHISDEIFVQPGLYNTDGGIYGYTFNMNLLKSYIEWLRPDWILTYIEPYSMAASQLLQLKETYKFKIQFFAYENLSMNLINLPRQLKDNFVNIHKADLVFCGNTPALHFMLRYDGNAYRIPHCGIEETLFKNYETVLGIDRKNRAIFIGRDVPEKGWDIMEYLQEQNIGVFRPNIFYDDAQMWEPYNHGKVFVHASKRIPTWKEQLGFVIAEALSCELPVVQSLHGDNIEWFRDAPNTFIASPLEKEEYLECVLLALEEFPNKEGRQWVIENFSNEVIAERWNNIIKKYDEE